MTGSNSKNLILSLAMYSDNNASIQFGGDLSDILSSLVAGIEIILSELTNGVEHREEMFNDIKSTIIDSIQECVTLDTLNEIEYKDEE